MKKGPSYILGISAFYHDSAAVLLRDGVIVAAAQEERFTRKKHDAAFPGRAVEYCLGEAGIGRGDLAWVAFYDKPLLKFDRLLETWLSFAPRGFGQFRMALPVWLGEKLHTRRELKKGLGGEYRGRLVFTEHHESHAASAFFPSPFQEAAIMTLDGVGEWATGSLGVGRGNKIELTRELRFPHSLGLLYSAFTYFTGFKVNSGEYKLMGLAPYGEPVYYERMRDTLMDLKADGSFRLDLSYFGYLTGAVMTSPKMAELFGGPPRAPESPITQREMDIAASIQKLTEEIVLRTGRFLHEETGQKKLVMAGGVALNCVGNGRLLREGPFEDIWIQPAAGDAGGALGTAMFVWHQLLGKEREIVHPDAQAGSLLGPTIDEAAVRSVAHDHGATAVRYGEAELCERVAALIADGKVVGHAAGRMEFGPRALGNRSILGDPRSPKMQSVMNLKIKFRESFRPFAPAVLRRRVHEFFEMRENEDSPYMLLVAPVAEGRRRAVDETLSGLEQLHAERSDVPAITHVDYSARVQTVDEQRHPRFHRILEAFEAKSGCPVLINTSFNVRGEPIVCTAEDAWRCFMATNMDALVLGDHLLLKSEQSGAQHFESDAHLASFELD